MHAPRGPPLTTRFVLLATQRTGSTVIWQTLDRHPRVAAFGEMFLEGLAHPASFATYLRASPLRRLALRAAPRRTTARYGSRAERYVAIEVGHAAQNVYLQAVGLGLGTVIVGAFDDSRVADLLGLAAGEHPLALLPVGRS